MRHDYTVWELVMWPRAPTRHLIPKQFGLKPALLRGQDAHCKPRFQINRNVSVSILVRWHNWFRPFAAIKLSVSVTLHMQCVKQSKCRPTHHISSIAFTLCFTIQIYFFLTRIMFQLVTLALISWKIWELANKHPLAGRVDENSVGWPVMANHG